MSDEPQVNPVIEAINRMVEEKTFGLEALKNIQTLRELAEKQAKDLLNRDRSLREMKYEADNWRSRHSEKEEQLKKFQQREAELLRREAACREAEKSEAVSKAVASTYDAMFTRMFANRTTREMVMENATRPVSTPTGVYGHTETSTRTTDRSEG